MTLRRTRSITALTLTASLALVAAPFSASAATSSTVIDFDAAGYSTVDGSPSAQNGWNGWGFSPSAYDWAIGANTAASGLPTDERSLRFSNSVANSGSYGNINQLTSPLLTQRAGETATGAMNDVFEASFTIASTTGALQPRLATSVAIDDGQGSRSGGTLTFLHGPTGLQLSSSWVDPAATGADTADWRTYTTPVYDATVPHDIRIVSRYVPGDTGTGADTLSVYVDGALAISGYTYEGYHEAAGSPQAQRTANSLLFRTSRALPQAAGTTVGFLVNSTPTNAELAALDGQGFLYSDIEYSTSAYSAPAVTTVPVTAADLSAVNASAASTRWDAATGAAAATIPVAGGKWILDIENKNKGDVSVTAQGLVLSVVGSPDFPSSANWTKARYQYYVGSGGYPAIDAGDPTLADLLASAVSWDTTLLSGDPTYGPTLQVQLQKLLTNGTYARVTVVSNWAPGTASTNLADGAWFANTAIYADGYPTGTANGYGTRAGISVLNAAGSGPGVDAQTLLTNFGDFEVVSFGPNLGRDRTYAYALQNLQAFGHTFVFQLPAVTPPPATTPPATGGTTPPPAGGGAAGPATPTVAAPQLPTEAQPVTLATIIEKYGPDTAALLRTYLRDTGRGEMPNIADLFEIEDELDLSDFSGWLEWKGDTSVTMWGYSSPTALGTYRISNGRLNLSSVDLTTLGAGTHHLLIVGEQSGKAEYAQFEVVAEEEAPAPAEPVVADSGSPLGWILGGAGLLVVVLVVLGIVLGRRQRNAY